MNVLIVDYRLSNLHSVEAACNAVDLNAEVSSDPDKIRKADALILPGVGSFGMAMKNIKDLSIDKSINDFVNTGKPFLGVCLGLQLLFETSEEFGEHQGLSLLKGSVKKFQKDNNLLTKYPVPQIGWNKIKKAQQNWNKSYLSHCKEDSFMYFVHSFYVEPADDTISLTKTSYGGLTYTSSVQKDNIFAVQFHPEKSGLTGINIYKNFKEQFKEI